MSRDKIILFPGENTWRMARRSGQGAPELKAVGASMESALAALEGWRGEVWIALPAGWCLCARVSTDGLPVRDRREALMYRLEEQLPLSAEEVAAEFLSTDGASTVLGVAVELQRIRPLIAALEARGCTVRAVTPASLLTLQELLPAAGPAEAVLWQRADGQVELFLLQAGRPFAWYVLAARAEDVYLHLGETPARLAAFGVDEALVKGLADRGVSVTAAPLQGGPDAAAARRVFSGTGRIWINLAESASPQSADQKLQKPLMTALAALILLTVSVCGTALWRTSGYEQMRASAANREAQAFARALPGKPIPSSVVLRLTSEERKLRGLSTDATDAPARTPALTHLYHLLAAMPKEERFRVNELRLDNDRLYMEGQTLSHGGADVLAGAIRGAGFVVEPAQTQQNLDKTVTFTLNGAAQAADNRRGAK